MNISWHWLSELLDLKNITPEQVYNKLTLAGFELENIKHNTDNDIILEISNTTNRSDTNSVIGITQEISGILQCCLNVQRTQINIPFWRQAIEVDDSNQEEYITSIINQIEIKESPNWLKDRLAIYNIPSINNIHDIINFIAIKWSHHINIIELNKVSADLTIDQLKTLEGNRKIAQAAFESHENTYKQTSDIVIQLSKNLPSITRKIYERCRYPEHIKILYKSNDADSRPSNIEAYSEVVSLITKLCNTQYPEQIVHLSTYHKLQKPIHFNYEKIYKILGPVKYKNAYTPQNLITPNTADKIFHNLYFINHTSRHKTYVEIPKYRIKDIEREIDLAEELSRIYGFNQFFDLIPANKLKGQQSTNKHRLNQLRSICRSIGLHEVIHSSLGERYKTKIHNPLNIEYDSLRNNLLWKLIQSSIYNIKQTKKSLEMFEIGRVFLKQPGQYIERIHLAGVLGGNKIVRNTWDRQPQNISWFQAKGDLEEIFERLNISITWNKSDNTQLDSFTLKDLQGYFKIKQYAILYSHDQQPIGIFGEIKTQNTNLPTTDPLYGFEIIIDPLMITSSSISSPHFKTYTKYPSIIRDIKIEVPQTWTMTKVLSNLYTVKSDFIESIELFDVYNNQSIQNRSKSLGFRITYSNPNSTLTAQEVNQIEQQFKNAAIKKVHE
uniref:phenylalanine--tRNA ligase n=1 Tax=Liagora brachyclada TaxID=1884665 RepID=A0A1G4P062_9FLOR|nr:Phenylalanine-tRNA ligase beta subunit [Liagora brachyclada]SCW24298.1 Phenylalanine-tRNA ligase beta subunit [Liagora brachyclada]